jgi:hypothetical protein
VSVAILNPGIQPAALTGKYIIIDVLARDAAGTYDPTTRQPSFPSAESNPHALNRWPDRARAATMGH